MPRRNTSNSNNSASYREKLKKKLLTALKQFNPIELETTVIPYFTNVSWDDIKEILIRKQLALNVVNIATTINDQLITNNVENKDIKDFMLYVELLAISKYSSRKVWYTYEMKNAINETVDTQFWKTSDLSESISASLKKFNFKTKAKILFYDDLHFVLIEEPLKTRQKNTIPSYTIFALKLDDNYFFCLKKYVSETVRNIMTEALGYRHHKIVNLHGKHLLTLCELLRNKKNGIERKGYIDMPDESEPIATEVGVDFTQHDHRKKFVETCMGTEDLKLESFSFTCTNAVIEHPKEYKTQKVDLSDFKLNMGWEFRSKNVFNMIPLLAAKRQLVHPLPSYLVQCAIMGKNEISYKMRT